MLTQNKNRKSLNMKKVGEMQIHDFYDIAVNIHLEIMINGVCIIKEFVVCQTQVSILVHQLMSRLLGTMPLQAILHN